MKCLSGIFVAFLWMFFCENDRNFFQLDTPFLHGAWVLWDDQLPGQEASGSQCAARL